MRPCVNKQKSTRKPAHCGTAHIVQYSTQEAEAGEFQVLQQGSCRPARATERQTIFKNKTKSKKKKKRQNRKPQTRIIWQTSNRLKDDGLLNYTKGEGAAGEMAQKLILTALSEDQDSITNSHTVAHNNSNSRYTTKHL